VSSASISVGTGELQQQNCVITSNASLFVEAFLEILL